MKNTPNSEQDQSSAQQLKLIELEALIENLTQEKESLSQEKERLFIEQRRLAAEHAVALSEKEKLLTEKIITLLF